MRELMHKKLILIILTCLSAAAAFAEETVYVKANKAKLMATPEFNAALVLTIEKGTALQVKATQGRWLQVTVQDKTGWVSQLLVGNEPPLNQATPLNTGDQSIKQDSRRRASATASAAAARGLRNDDRARQSDDAVSDYSALEKMDKLDVSEDEAVKFIEEGTD